MTANPLPKILTSHVVPMAGGARSIETQLVGGVIDSVYNQRNAGEKFSGVDAVIT